MGAFPRVRHFKLRPNWNAQKCSAPFKMSNLQLQRGSLAVAVLSQVPRDNEENRPLFTEARNMLLEVLKRGVARLSEEDAEEELDEDLDEETTT